MLDVFFTVDTEIWCESGWVNLDTEFPEAFRRYIHGRTPQGDYGLPFQLGLMKDHGLIGVFFTEPLFALRFGVEPLSEIVEMIEVAGQEVQLHLHTEWVDEAREPMFPGNKKKRPLMRQFSRDEQQQLLAIGRQLIIDAGGREPTAFRAGSFGLNCDTLLALASTGIMFDSSYNAGYGGINSGVEPGRTLLDMVNINGVTEFPMTVFDDGITPYRHTQVTACSFSELEGLLWQALEDGRRSFMILCHNFELLNPTQTRADPVAIRRFERLLAFLASHKKEFRVRGFRDLGSIDISAEAPKHLRSPLWKTALRTSMQVYRRRYR